MSRKPVSDDSTSVPADSRRSNDTEEPQANYIQRQILDELSKNGALCASQLSVRLGVRLDVIKSAIDKMVRKGLLEERHDLGEKRYGNEWEVAYSLNRGKWKFLSPGSWFSRKSRGE